jgi:hypothetical protein
MAGLPFVKPSGVVWYGTCAMLKYVLGGLVFLLAVTAAFYAGLFIGRARPEVPLGVPPPPPADHWTYPGSKELMRSGGQANFLSVLTTPDDLDAVARFYHRQICQANGMPEGNFDPQHTGLSSTGFAWGSYCYAADADQPADAARKARVFTFEVRSQSYDLNVFASRAEGERHTHVILTFDPKEPR